MLVRKNNNLYQRIGVHYWVGALFLASIGLAIAGELHAMLAWWLSIVLLLPPMMWAFKTPYVALKAICGISFLTQFSTSAIFYMNRDTFGWTHVKPFNFKAWEAFPMLAKVSLFLFALVLFFRLFYSISLFGKSPRELTNSNPLDTATQDRLSKFSSFHSSQNRKSWQFSVFIILMIAVLTPINLWSYSEGIGLTGVESRQLPYKLSGILFYSTKFITPVIFGYLYFKSERGWSLSLLLLAYAWLLGLCSVSKGAVLIVTSPVLVLAWVDNRKTLAFVVFFGAILGASFAESARSLVHIVIGGKTSADTSLNIFSLIINTITDAEREILSFNLIPNSVYQISHRVEGFGNLVMAQYYDPNAVGGSSVFILRMIWRGLSVIDINAHHYEWQGNVLPEGFYNGGSLLSTVVIVGNAGLWWVVLCAILSAIMLVIIEKSCNSLGRKYGISGLPVGMAIIFMSLVFFTEVGGSEIFLVPFFVLVITSFLPIIVGENKRYK